MVALHHTLFAIISLCLPLIMSFCNQLFQPQKDCNELKLKQVNDCFPDQQLETISLELHNPWRLDLWQHIQQGLILKLLTRALTSWRPWISVTLKFGSISVQVCFSLRAGILYGCDADVSARAGDARLPRPSVRAAVPKQGDRGLEQSGGGALQIVPHHNHLLSYGISSRGAF